MGNLDGKIARRYVKALYDLCELPDLEQIRDGLRDFSETWASSGELAECIESPGIPAQEKLQVVSDIAEGILPGHVIFRNFLLLLLDNRRLGDTGEIGVALTTLIDHLRKLLALNVTSASEIAEQERAAIAARVEKEFGSLAAIEWSVDPEIIGGLLVQVGDRLLDNSIRTSLEKMRSSLIS